MSSAVLKTPPSVTGRRHQSMRSMNLFNWLGVAAFIGIHLACLAVIWTGTNILALALCGSCYLVHMVGITAGYHRYFAHRAYKTSRVFQFLLGCMGCTALQKGPLWWVAHHRHHHRFSDTPKDPHSPLQTGFWWSHVGWILSPDYNETHWQVVRDLARYKELRWLNRNHWIPPFVLASLCFIVDSWSGLIWGAFVSTVVSHHAVFSVNSLCHYFGRRRYATSDDSRNNAFVAMITLGEGWHNNHHHYQSSANQGFVWWEIDFSYYLIKLWALLGLVWDVRRASKETVNDQSSLSAVNSAGAPS